MSKRKYVFGMSYYYKTLAPKHRAMTKLKWLYDKAPWTSSWNDRYERKLRRIVKYTSKADKSSIYTFVYGVGGTPNE